MLRFVYVLVQMFRNTRDVRVILWNDLRFSKYASFSKRDLLRNQSTVARKLLRQKQKGEAKQT